MKEKAGMTSEDEQARYTREAAARLAHISLELLYQCEQERLVEPRRMRGGEAGFSLGDVSRLARIRRLREDLELDMPAIEIVLRMRQQMMDLFRQLDEMERVMAIREEELMAEIRTLQRFVAEFNS